MNDYHDHEDHRPCCVDCNNVLTPEEIERFTSRCEVCYNNNLYEFNDLQH